MEGKRSSPVPSLALVLSGSSGLAQELEGAASLVATETKLVPGEPEQGAYLGCDVAVSGDTAVVGAAGSGGRWLPEWPARSGQDRPQAVPRLAAVSYHHHM